MKDKVKIGLFGIGLNTYWGQFDGLLDRLMTYQKEIYSRLSLFDEGVEIIDGGMVDSPQVAQEVALTLKKENIEICFLFISTYALSSTVLPIAQQLKVPIILLNVQPVAAIDYDYLNGLNDRGKMTGDWLAHCQACSLPEIAAVFNRSAIKYEVVSGYLQEEATWNEIHAWIAAAQVVYTMRNNRMGLLGHYYGGMLDVYTDLTMQSAIFGTHIEMLEMCELHALREAVAPEDLQNKIAEFHRQFVVAPECETSEIERAARTSVALDQLVASHQLGSLVYYYEGQNGNAYENIVTSIIAGNTLLTGKGIPVAGEYEVKTAQAMKIMSTLGAGGSFSEFYALDFNDDVVLLGHDGPAHFAIAEQQVSLVPLPMYHGKPGKGLSIQMSVKQGPVTLLSVCEGISGVFLLMAEGASVSGPTLQIGNTNSRYRFPAGAKSFINNWSKAGPSHHCAIGVGHLGERIEKIAFLLNLPLVKV